MPKPRAAKKVVNYAYDPLKGVNLKSITKKRHVKGKAVGGPPGRAKAAPPLTTWPVNGQSNAVSYHNDIDNDLTWVAGANEIQLPFRHLDVNEAATWQGLKQTVAGLQFDAKAQTHFEAIADQMRTAKNGKNITEAVGEAAAAVCMLTNNSFSGYKLIWGFDTHSGTGIDQIWRKIVNVGVANYIIVEAKGPGASLNVSPFLPTGYNQMDQGWVVNHLYSMNNNNHAAGIEIVSAMKLKFTVAHANFGGASTSYYGLDAKSGHKGMASKVFGLVVTAEWLSDGRLSYKTSNATQYLT